MPRAIPAAISVEAVRKWLFLAKQRMAHLVELYESGRWRYYYTDAEFIDRLREAIRGVDRWSATEQAVIDRLADGAAESERRVAPTRGVFPGRPEPISTVPRARCFSRCVAYCCTG